MGQPCPASTCDQATNPAARATWAPGRSTAHGRAVEPVAHRHLHQLVVGGVVVHLVDPMAEAVVGAQLGRVPVRLEPPADGLGRAGQTPERVQVFDSPARALPLDALDQGGVSAEHVVALEGRRLVGDLMGGDHGLHGARRAPGPGA